MITYAEKKGMYPIDWHKELSNKNISKKKWEELEQSSETWVTCACGVQCAIIPRGSAGDPLDAKLRILGGDDGFHGAIMKKHRHKAMEWLQKIEIRSKQLIKEEVKILKAALAETDITC